MIKPQLQADSLLSLYQTAFQSSIQGFCLLEKVPTPPTAPPDFRYLMTNPAFEQQVGLHQPVGKTIRQLVPGVEERILDYYDGVALTRQPIHFEDYVATLDMWFAVDVFGVGELEPAWIGILFVNITERKSAEKQQAYLLTLSDALRPLADPIDMQAQAMRVLGEHFGTVRALFWEAEPDREHFVSRDGYAQGMSPIATRVRLDDLGVHLKKHFTTGRTLVIANTADDPQVTQQELAAYDALNCRAYIGVPLVKRGRLVAILGLYRAQAHKWTAQDVVLVEQTAERTWAALERARAEEALRQSEERFRLFIRASSDVIYTMNADWSQMHNLMGKSFLADTPVASRSWLEQYIPLQDQSSVQAVIQQAIHHKRTFELEHPIIRADGSLGWTHSRAIPLLDEQGQITEWFGTASDVTARKKAEQSLQESEARYRQLSMDLEEVVEQRTEALRITIADLQRSNANLEQFAYIASHDLQEPLRKIKAFGDLLRDQYSPQLGEGGDYIDRMQKAASRMTTLIADLLSYSRIATQQENAAPVSLTRVLDTVLNNLEMVIDETSAQVALDPLPTVTGDATQLGQLFQNLLSNAIKFRRPTITPLIQIRCQRIRQSDLPTTLRPTRAAQAYSCIEVVDNGIGFDEKYLDRIFAIFQRLHGKGEYAGTGIGLAICEKVVANHGGAITATSQPGQGAIFSVYLPV